MRRLINPFRSIRSRMWTALTLLAGATILVGSVAWFTLDRANSNLNKLHRQTLSEVARALSLSKRSADLSTTAPYLLNLSSAYRINKEGRQLIEMLDIVQRDWSDGGIIGENESEFSNKVSVSLSAMRTAISNLINSSEQLDTFLQKVHTTNTELSNLRNSFLEKMRASNVEQENRLNWLALQSMANQALGAGFTGNLLGVGEHHRNLVDLQMALETVELTTEQTVSYIQVLDLSLGVGGIFELRRKELSFNLTAQNALFHIRYNAGLISDFTGELATQAESFLSQKRDETSLSIAFAKTLIFAIAIASILIALTSALYFSNYVTKNISLVSSAMKRLAAGDRKSELTKKISKKDEIGDLFRSFRVFRANALRLDRSNNQLYRRNALFEKVFNNISDGVAITDEYGRLSAHNPIFETILKITTQSPPHGNITNILKTSHFADAASEAKLNKGFRGFVELQSDDGQVVEVRATRLPDDGRVWLFSDATERRKIGEQLNEIRRIESLGKVTGEVAHDFGNILSTISSNLFLLESKAESKKAQNIRERISNAVEIGTSLTQRLLAFAKKQHLTPEITELNNLVEGLTDLVSIGFREDVVLKTELTNDEVFVKVDPGQLESAIFNLCLNSNQALPEGGVITITVKSTSSQFAVIEVTDNGVGMDKQTKSQAMEPFFTNRYDGEGTGLGLSMVYGFIKQTGGDIQIDSKLGKGTKVSISLPITVKEQSKNKTPLQSKMRALIVEDDPTTMETATKILRDIGYSTAKASSFQKGMRKIQDSEIFDLLVTDLQLDDGKSGWQLAEHVLESSSFSRVVVVSGHLPKQHPLMNRFSDRLICLSKPYDSDILKSVINIEPIPNSKEFA